MATIAASLILNTARAQARCREDPEDYVSVITEFSAMAMTLVIGTSFIMNVRNLRSGTWKQQRCHNIILIIAIEATLVLQRFLFYSNLFSEFIAEGDLEGNDDNYLINTLAHLLNFLTQDLLFVYLWILFSFPEDTFQLYNEIENTQFSIF